jgi:hypothetical protein
VFNGFALVVGHSFTLFLGYFMGLLDSFIFNGITWDSFRRTLSFLLI